MENISIFSRGTGVITSHGETLLIVGWCLLFATTIVLSLRAWARISRAGFLNLSDYLMLIAYVLEIFHMVFITVAFTYGLGKHFNELDPNDIQHALMYTIGFIELFAVTPCMFGRISFAVFLLYILGPTQTAKRITLWAIIAIQVVINFIVVVQIYSQCGSHFDALWKPEVHATANCQPATVETIIGYVQSALNSLCDILLTIIPAIVIWTLQMPRRQKIILACVLLLSVFAFVASIVKAIEIKNLSATGDFTWYITDLQMWVCVENNVVMMAASTPALKPLLGKKSGSQPAPYYGNSYEMNDSHPWSRNRREKNSVTTGTFGDTYSEEHILPGELDPPEITKTVDVSVQYDSRSQHKQSFKSRPTGGGRFPRLPSDSSLQ